MLNQPQPWTSDPHKIYVPIAYEGDVVGFCEPHYAAQILATLNEDDKLRKALELACYDLIARSGSSTEVATLLQQYLAKAERPTQGTGAIALLLKERQLDLDLTDEKFAKFCDTFRLSRDELNGIYAGEEIDSKQLTPLSRILGMTIDDLIEVWKGGAND